MDDSKRTKKKETVSCIVPSKEYFFSVERSLTTHSARGGVLFQQTFSYSSSIKGSLKAAVLSLIVALVNYLVQWRLNYRRFRTISTHVPQKKKKQEKNENLLLCLLYSARSEGETL